MITLGISSKNANPTLSKSETERVKIHSLMKRDMDFWMPKIKKLKARSRILMELAQVGIL